MSFRDLSDIDFGRAETAHRQAIWAHSMRNRKDMYGGSLGDRAESERFQSVGMRAAREQDAQLIRILERVSSILTKEMHRQQGNRGYVNDAGQSVELTEVGLWRAAYECAERGSPLENFASIYGAAAWLAGYVPNWRVR